jgi:hypothetical protein
VYVTGLVMVEGGSNIASLVYVYARGTQADGDAFFFVQQRVDSQGSYRQDSLGAFEPGRHRPTVDIDLAVDGAILVRVDGERRIDRTRESFLVANAPRAVLGAGSVNGGFGLTFFADDYRFMIE